MNPLDRKRIALYSAIRNGEPLDDHIEAIEFALKNSADSWAIPWKEDSGYVLLGDEVWKNYAGLQAAKTIAWHAKTDAWLTCATKRGMRIGTVMAWTHARLSGELEDPGYGPIGGSFQSMLSEAPQHKERPTVYRTLQSQFGQLNQLGGLPVSGGGGEIQTAEYVDQWLRDHFVAAERADDGIVESGQAYLNSFYYERQVRGFKSDHRKLNDRVRNNVKNAFSILRERGNPMTREIACYLDAHIKVGAMCEYTGDWPFNFV